MTDDPTGLRAEIRPVVWPSYGFGRARRLQLYDKALAVRDIGKRILQMDLDCIVTGDLTPLVDRSEPLVVWQSVHLTRYLYSGDTGVLGENTKHEADPFNASMVLMDAGVMPTVWTDYISDPKSVERRAKKAGYWTALIVDGKAVMIEPGDDDQAVMTLYAKPLNPPTWGEADGIYKYKRLNGSLPANARLVFFQGHEAESYVERSPWIREYLN